MSKTKLELTWIGKDKRPKLEPRILLEDPALSYHAKHRVSDNDQFDNKLIFGDNLLALKALVQEYIGEVKCIYIDPPYNTGSAFTHYDDGLEHSIWLSLMRDRLELLRDLLAEDGSIWVSIDDNEAHYLKVMMDEVFGRRNFIASNVWQKRYSRENREAIGDVHEYLFVYAKQPELFKQNRNLVTLTELQAKVYRNPNNDPLGRWRPIPMTAQEGHATSEQFYEVVTPSGKIHRPPEGRCWGIARATYEKLLSEGRIYFGKKGDSQPNIIRYLSEVAGVAPWTWWPSDEVGHTDESKKEIHNLFGKTAAFDSPKPERLIQRILHIATNPGDLVLDSFAGSGTTGAVAHKMGRRWIMIELGEHCHTHIIPRLQKVIDGEDQGGISKAVNWQGGGGFRYYRLAPSLLEQDRWGNWVVNKNYNPAMLAEALCKLEGYTYAPGRSDVVRMNSHLQPAEHSPLQPDSQTVGANSFAHPTEHWWQHGYSSERDFIYVTTQNLSHQQLQELSAEVGGDRTLLVCCAAFRGKADAFPNLTIKKIPKMVLSRCEWAHDDYSLNVANLPMAQPEPEAEKPKKANVKPVNTAQDDLFGEI